MAAPLLPLLPRLLLPPLPRIARLDNTSAHEGSQAMMMKHLVQAQRGSHHSQQQGRLE